MTKAGTSAALDSKGKKIVAFELDAVRVPVAFNVSEQMAVCLSTAPSWYAIGSAAAPRFHLGPQGRRHRRRDDGRGLWTNRPR
jgi:hypothetical protein